MKFIMGALLFQAEDGIRDPLWSRGLGDVYNIHPNYSIFKIANNGFIGSPYIEIELGNSNEIFKNNDYTINNVDAVSLEEIINNFIFK